MAKSDLLCVPVSHQEGREIRAAAKRENLSLAAWMRRAARLQLTPEAQRKVPDRLTYGPGRPRHRAAVPPPSITPEERRALFANFDPARAFEDPGPPASPEMPEPARAEPA